MATEREIKHSVRVNLLLIKDREKAYYSGPPPLCNDEFIFSFCFSRQDHDNHLTLLVGIRPSDLRLVARLVVACFCSLLVLLLLLELIKN